MINRIGSGPPIPRLGGSALDATAGAACDPVEQLRQYLAKTACSGGTPDIPTLKKMVAQLERGVAAQLLGTMGGGPAADPVAHARLPAGAGGCTCAMCRRLAAATGGGGGGVAVGGAAGPLGAQVLQPARPLTRGEIVQAQIDDAAARILQRAGIAVPTAVIDDGIKNGQASGNFDVVHSGIDPLRPGREVS